ncbi:MAG: hypothetical protein WAL59_00225, partial [Roseiarcus sp.]
AASIEVTYKYNARQLVAQDQIADQIAAARRSTRASRRPEFLRRRSRSPHDSPRGAAIAVDEFDGGEADVKFPHRNALKR